MDIISLLAPKAVELLVSFLKGMLSEGAKNLGKELFDVIKRKFSNSDDQKTLANLENMPDNKKLQEIIQANLVEAMANDEKFLSKIQTLNKQIQVINIENIEKAIFSPVNIENFHGNLTVIYKQKANEISRFKASTSGLDEYSDELLSGLSDNELMPPDTVIKLLFILFKHSQPQLLFDEIVETRLAEDLVTFLAFLPFAHTLIMEATKVTNPQNIFEDFERMRKIIISAESIKHLFDSKGNLPIPEEEMIQDYLKKFDNEFSENFFVHAHPELLLMNSDFSIAIYCFVAFGNSDTKAVNFFMDKRQTLANFRSKSKMI